jgi:hypothetical protein
MTEDAVFEALALECRVDKYGTVRYFNTLGKLHRVYGPAVEWPDGRRAWWQNGLRHRLDGPAVEYSDGYRAWYINDQLHRLDGPAVEWPDGTHRWYIDDNELTQDEWQKHKSKTIENNTLVAQR